VSVAIAIGIVGVSVNLALGLLVGLGAWWGRALAARLRPTPATA
jgi:hypothetical protein